MLAALSLTPYRDLLRRNPDFLRLWLGQVVSQMGDWFSSIAIYSLLLERTGRAESVAFALIAQLLPIFLLAPFAGIVADRLDRRSILIATDWLRAAVVAGLILAEEVPGTALVYALVVVQVSLSAFFEPARAALLPQVTRREDWLTANTLGGVTWSAMLALGSGLGGGVAALLGRKAAFAIDALSFILSARILAGLPRRAPRVEPASGWRAPLRASLGGFGYMRRHPAVGWILLLKTAWGIGGGVLVLYTIFGQRVFPLGKGAAASIGLLYAVRGLGAAAGPILGRAWLGSSPRDLARNIAVAFALAGACFLVFARAPNLPLALLGVFGSHLGGSMIWVFSTTLLQIASPEAYRGRLAALEIGGLTLSIAASNYATALALDRGGIDPRDLAAALALYFFLPALLWGFAIWKGRDRLDAALAAGSAAPDAESPLAPASAEGGPFPPGSP